MANNSSCCISLSLEVNPDECSDACALLCALIYSGFYGKNLANQKKSLLFFQKSIDKGNPKSVNYLLSAYLSGKILGRESGIRPSYSKWLNLCRTLSKNGNVQIAFSVGAWFVGLKEPGDDVDEKVKERIKYNPILAKEFFTYCLEKEDGPYHASAKKILEMKF